MGPTQDTTNVYSTPQSAGQPQAQMPGAGTPAMTALGSLLAQQQELQARQAVLDQHALQPVKQSILTQSAASIQPGGPIAKQSMIDTPTYGARANRNQGIANIVIGAANLVGSVKNRQVAKQQQETQIATERVLQATDAINQAKQVLANDPNNAAAKDAIKTNTDLINMMDPKKLKLVAKALDINFVDPSQNNKPEHKAGQQAIASFAEQLQKQLPQGVAPNQQAIAAAQANRQQQAELTKTIQSVMPAIKQSIADQDKADLQTQKDTAAADRQNARLDWTAHEDAAKAEASFTRAMEVAKERVHGALMVAAIHEQGENSRFQQRIAQLRGNTKDISEMSTKDLTAMLTATVKEQAQSANQVAGYSKLRDQYYNQKDDNGVTNANHFIDASGSMQKYASDLAAKIQAELAKRAGGVNGTDNSNTGNNKSSVQPQTVSAPTADDTDDDDEDDPDKYN